MSAVILVVEDEDSVGRLMRRALEREGHCVHVAQTGAGALEHARGTSFDLVVCDVGLPDLAGPALLQRLRDLQPSLRCVLTSGHTPEELERRGAGAETVLRKPFHLYELVRAVRRALAPELAGERKAAMS